MGSGAEGAREKEKKMAAGRFRDFLCFILIASSAGFDMPAAHGIMELRELFIAS